MFCEIIHEFSLEFKFIKLNFYDKFVLFGKVWFLFYGRPNLHLTKVCFGY